jgi:hypothetical protein
MSIDATNLFNGISVYIQEEDITVKVSSGLRGPVGFEYKGTYSAGTTYYYTNVVTYGNALYISNVTSPADGHSGNTPSGGGYWTQILDSTGPFSAIASQAQAEAGTDNTTGMTPLRTKQAIDALSFDEDSADYIQFNTAVAPPYSEGQIHWNDADKTLEIDTEVSGTAIQVGQEVVKRVTNKTGAQIPNGTAVYINGAQGSRPTIALAKADAEATSVGVAGLTTNTIDDNATGYVTSIGLVRGINTTGGPVSETWAAGDGLYLSPTTAGALTKVEPVSPNHSVKVADVVYAHSTQGILDIHVQDGFEISELHDVLITSVTDEDYLSYDSATSLWKNVKLPNATAELTIGHTTDNSTATTCTALDTYYPLAGTWTAHHTNNITLDGSTGKFTIATGRDGDYEFVAELSMIASRASDILCFSFIKNGAYVTGTPRIRRKIGTAADVGALSVSAQFHGLVATDYIQCAVQLITGDGANTAGDSATIENGSIRATQLI